MILLLFVLGTLVGSFLNVCIWRLPRHESVVHPPSHCPSCNTRLTFLDLFPLVSQFLLRGRCRYCGAKFSWRYFGIELLTGILFALVGSQSAIGADLNLATTDDWLRLARDLIFISTLVVIFFVDYDTRLMQLESVFLLGLAGIAYQAWKVWNNQAALTDGKLLAALLPAPVPEAILAAVGAASGLWLVRAFFSWLFGKEALGFGDVILVAGIGTYLGWNATLLTFFFLASVLGSIAGVSLQIPRAVRAYRWAKARIARYGSSTKGGDVLPRALARHAFRKAMPFGPMLAIGAVAALLFGTQINAAYMDWVMPPEPPLTRLMLPLNDTFPQTP